MKCSVLQTLAMTTHRSIQKVHPNRGFANSFMLSLFLKHFDEILLKTACPFISESYKQMKTKTEAVHVRHIPV
jgi:hypothetical protein